MTEREEMILGSAERFCRNALEVGNMVADGLLNVRRLTSFSLNPLRGVTQRVIVRWALAQREGEQMILASGFEKRNVQKSVGVVQK